MSTSTLTLPVSIEQIAEAIKQMSEAELLRLFDLVPKIRFLTSEGVSTSLTAKQRRRRTQEQIEASVAAVQAELMEALNHQPISGNAPFLGGLSLNEYLALPDDEQGRIWDEAAEIDWDDLEEREVRADAIPAR